MLIEHFLVISVAIISSISRAIINVIDRWQLCYKGECIVKISFLNNLLPFLVAITFGLSFGFALKIIQSIICIETFIFGAIAQSVALIFSFAIKRFELFKVTLMSKPSDFLISLTFGILRGFINVAEISIHLLSCLISAPLFFKFKIFGLRVYSFILLIVLGLTIQAVLGKFLINSSFTDINYLDIIFFSIGVIFWRGVWSMLLLLYKTKLHKSLFIPSKITFVRAFLTLLTQSSFIYVISSRHVNIAVPILNLTGFFSILLANFLMKEPIDRNSLGLIFLTFIVCGFLSYV